VKGSGISSPPAAARASSWAVNLTAGKSGLILDLVIEAGNRADSERLVPMLERHIAFWGAAPRQAAADGGFASRDNLAEAKARGVEDTRLRTARAASPTRPETAPRAERARPSGEGIGILIRGDRRLSN
jgi:IS5 family transposase